MTGFVEPVSFPIKVAAIDIGSNAIRNVVAEFSGPGTFTELASDRYAVRLGRDVFTRSRRLSPQTIAAGTAALTQIRRRLDDLGVGHYRAVATSAVRESRNGGEFVEAVRRESGIHVETISGTEEARLVWLAVRSRLPLGDAHWFLMDLGGGSVEVSIVNGERILWSESHTLGSVRLLQSFEEDGGVAEGASYRRVLERYVHMLRVPRAVAEWRPVGAVATGGNIDALAGLADAPRNGSGVAVLPLELLRDVLDHLAEHTVRERIEALGLRDDRADVIVPAAIVYERVAELAGASEILVPGVGVKEGVLLDMAERIHDESGHADRRSRTVMQAAVALGRRFRFDEEHARQVATLSLALFDQLRTLHGLGAHERLLLLVGALLHDIGQYVSYRGHHKHSLYLISRSELPDLSPTEMLEAALIARYHRRAQPKESHEDFMALSQEGKNRVRHLAALLRVADALDREHVARVSRIHCVVQEDEIVLQVETRGDLTLEEWALRKKGRMFEDVYGRAIRLENRPTGP